MNFINTYSIADILNLILIVITLSGVVFSYCHSMRVIEDNHKQNFRPYLKLSNLKFKVVFNSIYKLNLIGKNTDSRDKKIRKVKIAIEIKNIGIGPAQNIFIYSPNRIPIDDRIITQNLSFGANESISFETTLQYINREPDNTYIIIFFQDIYGNLYSTKFDIIIFFKNNRPGISIIPQKIIDFKNSKIDKKIFSEVLEDAYKELLKYSQSISVDFIKKIK